MDPFLALSRPPARGVAPASPPAGLGGERYALETRLGAGAFGAVYAAWDHLRGERIALKVLTATDAEAIGRFKQEYRLLDEIRHPNVVRPHELHGEAGRWFFGMELVAGGGFLSALEPAEERGQARWLDRLGDRFYQLARALADLHAMGLAHGDVKPGNVAVSLGGRVVLLDFGLADRTRGNRPSAHRQRLPGTPASMAPERLAGGPPTPAGDWYGVGAMLCLALGGELPLPAPRHRTTSAPPPLPSGPRRRAAPPALVTLCHRLLAQDPAERPLAQEILDTLAPLAPARHHRLPATPAPSVASRRRRPALPDTVPAGLRQAVRGALEAVCRRERAAVFLLAGSVEHRAGAVAATRATVNTAAPGALVLAARCSPREHLPFPVLDGLIDRLGEHLGALPRGEAEALLPEVSLLASVFPVLLGIEAVERAPRRTLGRGGARGLERRLLVALRTVLARVATTRPLVLIVDELHWAGRAGAAQLGALLAPPAPPPILLVAGVDLEPALAATWLPTLVGETGETSSHLVACGSGVAACHAGAAAGTDRPNPAPSDRG
jgi:hypothetical protein